MTDPGAAICPPICNGFDATTLVLSTWALTFFLWLEFKDDFEAWVRRRLGRQR